ncbi:hypothetical protein SteCoe_7188 [Stentor coeruleus]|uniref:GAR domain-containing protein n=1 Tax=Stentor coeruleus TaxID=5963 RepID=A0A1R2CNE4_9CILI|nr:hypothetical protein SteCoe_7188 [Stentor coeruleus]
MNLSVIQTENLENDQAALGCYISVDNQLIDIVTPISSLYNESFTEIPNNGTIEFVIKDMRKDEVVGVLVLNIEDIQKDSEKWYELESMLVPTPKVLISSNGGSQISKSIKKSPQKEELLHKINELSTTVLELECQLGLEKEEKHREIESKTKIVQSIQNGSDFTIEQLKIKLASAYTLIEEFSLEKDNLIKLCEIEHEKSKTLEKKLKDIKWKYDETIDRIKSSELSYMNENHSLQEELRKTKEALNNELCVKGTREAFIAQLSYKITSQKCFENTDGELIKRIETLSKQLENSENTKNTLRAMLESKDDDMIIEKNCLNCQTIQEKCEFLESTIENLQEIVAHQTAAESISTMLKEKIVYHEAEIECLQTLIATKNEETDALNDVINLKTLELDAVITENDEIVHESSELKRRILTMNKNIDTLEREILDLKCRNISAKKVEKIKLDDIDFNLDSYLSEQGIENLFVKMAHGVYLYGTKRVNIDIKNDNRLICRTGGGYMPIDEFLKLYQNTEVEDISKYVKKQSLFLAQGGSPLRKMHNRASSSTPEITSRKASPRENFTERNFENKIIDKLKVVYPLKERNCTPIPRKSK